ncbi:family 78 glycoside hydrolase catalytic domain [Paenibacillus albidus]|uniref:family 78 glycoside hydrolase catalytic domain n=1 Tax=Paenibacillus albidus TaxID=2041023 RepID=UPI001BE77A34|nr:family 78 glycoside hydrolase catalytic domain [Paenibacillus albidus]MBT2293477.1 family 78 glycoside hydrolase catalytic domain [Paenibacillus albidus]
MDNVKFFFIEPESETPEKKCLQPASYIRKSFNIKGKVQKAILYTTGLGVYVPYVNGHEVGDSLLMPGFTNYRKRLQYFAKDVTEYIKDGENVIAAILGDGWYRGSLGAFSMRAFYGEKIKFAASLELVTDQGTSWVFTDEEKTKASQDGPIRGNDLKTFEIVDMTKEMSGWNREGFDDSNWHNCLPSSYDGELISHQGENILEHELFSPQIIFTPNGEHILDFGQNFSGHVEFKVSGAFGTKVVLEMGETLDEDGNFTTKNLSTVACENINEGMEVPESVLGQTLVYTLKEGVQKYKSTFLISGFRYVRLTNWPEEIKSENFTDVAVYGDLKYSGDFRCSNEKINQLVNNVRWSQKSNFVEVPTDCPTRERAGWTGDVNVFAETACYLSDTRKFLKKWLQDFVELQKDDGSLPFIVPEIPMFTDGVDMQNLPYSSAGWSDALLNVPLIMYQFYGEKEILQLVYDAAKKYVDFNELRAKAKHKFHFYKTGKHYKYILDTGYHWGEWLEPGSSMMKDSIKALTFPDSEVATAWFYHSAKQLSQMAEILHETEDQHKYDELAQNIKKAYQKEFLKRGKVHSKRQSRFVRPVAMELVDPKYSQRIVKQLQKLCEKNQYKVGTGFLTTYKILQVLTDYGYAETAYKMLTQNECPGWMYEIDKGATTIWENWLGIDEGGVPKDSQNHYAMGASVAWLFSRVGGIQTMEPGFSVVKIQPIVVGDLQWTETSYESIHGMISTRWERNNGHFKLQVSLPENVTGVVVMPDKKEYKVSGNKELKCELS